MNLTDAIAIVAESLKDNPEATSAFAEIISTLYGKSTVSRCRYRRHGRGVLRRRIIAYLSTGHHTTAEIVAHLNENGILTNTVNVSTALWQMRSIYPDNLLVYGSRNSYTYFWDANVEGAPAEPPAPAPVPVSIPVPASAPAPAPVDIHTFAAMRSVVELIKNAPRSADDITLFLERSRLIKTSTEKVINMIRTEYPMLIEVNRRGTTYYRLHREHLPEPVVLNGG